jgi:hypothetical protein
MKRQNLWANVLSALSLLALAVFCLHELGDPDLSPGAVRFPRLLSFVLVGLSLLLIIQSLYAYFRAFPRPAKPKSSGGTRGRLQRETAPFIVVFFSACFVALMNRIGFELSAFLTMFGAMVLMDPKEGIRKIYLAALTPLALIFIFKIGMGLRMYLLTETLFESLMR